MVSWTRTSLPDVEVIARDVPQPGHPQHRAVLATGTVRAPLQAYDRALRGPVARATRATRRDHRDGRVADRIASEAGLVLSPRNATLDAEVEHDAAEVDELQRRRFSLRTETGPHDAEAAIDGVAAHQETGASATARNGPSRFPGCCVAGLAGDGVGAVGWSAMILDCWRSRARCPVQRPGCRVCATAGRSAGWRR